MSRRSRAVRKARAEGLLDVDGAVPLNSRGGPDVDVTAALPLEEIPTVPTDPLRLGIPAGCYLRRYLLGECTVIVTREGDRWHLSIAHRARDPTWDEIAQARYRILPDGIWMAMYLPPRREYVNLNRFCFQMLECDPPPSEVS